jgi:hypothetical protein
VKFFDSPDVSTPTKEYIAKSVYAVFDRQTGAITQLYIRARKDGKSHLEN